MYYCQMPECDYVCKDKSQINFHHIVPKSMGGSNRECNLIELCPNCHSKVYIPEMEHGTHAIRHNNSVILLGKLYSTGGHVIEYKDVEDDTIKYSMLK